MLHIPHSVELIDHFFASQFTQQLLWPNGGKRKKIRKQNRLASSIFVNLPSL